MGAYLTLSSWRVEIVEYSLLLFFFYLAPLAPFAVTIHPLSLFPIPNNRQAPSL